MDSPSSASGNARRLLKAGASWDAERQTLYRRSHPQECLTFHMILDASPSMRGDHTINLIRAYNMYQDWLKAHVSPMSQIEVTVFSTESRTRHAIPIGEAQPLTRTVYDPTQGDGTAIYKTVGQRLRSPTEGGNHILVLFTDGQDNMSAMYGWDLRDMRGLLHSAIYDGWLCVYLAAYQEGKTTGVRMGFPEDNCLVFTSDRIPDAFKTLTRATQRFLQAAPAERRMLIAGGMFV